MLERLLDSVKVMRKRAVVLIILGVALTGISFFGRNLELRDLPTELFSLIAAMFFIYGLIVAVHNTNSLAPMFFSFRYTKAKFFTRKKMQPEALMDPNADDYVSVDDGGFHYELYSDYLRDRRKWSGMAGSFLLAALFMILAIATVPLTL